MITVTASANPVYASQSVTFTATLSDPTITGSIIFADVAKDNDNPLDPMADTTEGTLGTATISNGVATLTAKLPVGGSNTIVAVYGPNIYAPIAQGQLAEMVNIPFTLNSGNTEISLTASSGKSASVTIPIQALGGFTGPVTLGCTNGTPVCSFSPATVNLAGRGTASVTLTVTAVSATPTSTAVLQHRGMMLAFGIPLFALLGFAGRGRRCLLLLFGAAICLMPFTGCGGGSRPPNSLDPGSYPFVVTATSGQNVQTIGVTLTVQ